MKKALLILILVILVVVLSACSSGGNDVSKTYNAALNDIKNGKYAKAAEKLSEISFYEDSVQLSLYCRANAKAAEGDYDNAITELQKLGSYRDAEQCAEYFEARKIEAEVTNLYDRAYVARLYDSENINGFRDSSSRATSIRQSLYKEGSQAQENEEWLEALSFFEVLGNYEDSSVRSAYVSGRSYEANGEKIFTDYVSAIKAYDIADDYLDSNTRKNQCLSIVFEKADQLINAEDYDEAEMLYQSLGDFCGEDRWIALKETRASAEEAAHRKKIAEADTLLEEGKYDEAKQAYLNIGEEEMARVAIHQKADALLKEDHFDEAKETYLEADETELANEAMYRKALFLEKNGEKEESATLYWEIINYKDSREKFYHLVADLKESDSTIASRVLLLAAENMLQQLDPMSKEYRKVNETAAILYSSSQMELVDAIEQLVQVMSGIY